MDGQDMFGQDFAPASLAGLRVVQTLPLGMGVLDSTAVWGETAPKRGSGATPLTATSIQSSKLLEKMRDSTPIFLASGVQPAHGDKYPSGGRQWGSRRRGQSYAKRRLTESTPREVKRDDDAVVAQPDDDARVPLSLVEAGRDCPVSHV